MRRSYLSKISSAPAVIRFLSRRWNSSNPSWGQDVGPTTVSLPPSMHKPAPCSSYYLGPLSSFKAAFGAISELPYCSGTVPLDVKTSILFYRTGIEDKAESLNVAHPTEAQLFSLSEACQKATFGLNQKDVLDESYRKAGKLDATEISTQFSPLTSGIIDTVRQSLLQAEHADKFIKIELYKLNVYGPGSFFKTHVDTPRSDTMFGSLVVVFPTPHEGGSLIFRHRGQERTFDTAHTVTSQNSPHAAFVAFFSDVEHEVSAVTSGYRVTLTYNLYFDDQLPPAPATSEVMPDNNTLDQMKSDLSVLLSDPEFLPKGGLLGFGLSHKYPLNPYSTKLSELEKRLKGSDACIRHVCNAVSLDVSLKTVFRYEDHAELCLFDHFESPTDPYDEPMFYYHKDNGHGTYIYDWEGHSDLDDALPIVWVKPLCESNTFRQPYAAYGNEVWLDYTYGEVCLVAKIGAYRHGTLVRENTI